MPDITDPNEPYFKDGIWGWDGAVWRRLPIVWGYSADYRQALSALAVGAGTRLLTGTAVDPGEVWVVTHMTAQNTSSTTASTRIYVIDNATTYPVRQQLAPAAWEEVMWTGWLPLHEGAYLRAYFYGCVLNDNIYFTIHGYKMLIAE